MGSAVKLEIRRKLFISAGFAALALGIVGIPLPLLPTTPFLLLAAFCFDRGSPRFHTWLLQHRFFGPPILAWQRDRTIAPQAKISATVMLALGWALLLYLPYPPRSLKIVYSTFALVGLVFIWTRKRL